MARVVRFYETGGPGGHDVEFAVAVEIAQSHGRNTLTGKKMVCEGTKLPLFVPDRTLTKLPDWGVPFTEPKKLAVTAMSGQAVRHWPAVSNWWAVLLTCTLLASHFRNGSRSSCCRWSTTSCAGWPHRRWPARSQGRRSNQPP